MTTFQKKTLLKLKTRNNNNKTFENLFTFKMYISLKFL